MLEPETTLSEAPDLIPANRMVALSPQKTGGRPALVSPEIAHTIANKIRLGSYWQPACEAAGVAYNTVRKWISRAQDDEASGLTDANSPYLEFRNILARATAEGETVMVESLALDADWRARAFVLERRHRERWGKSDAPTSVTNVVISDALVAQLVDSLRVAAAPKELIDSIDITPVSASDKP